MIKAQYINLNMIPSGVMPVLYCSQYDVGRPLGMVVYNGSEAVDLSTYAVTIEGTRTDGTSITAAVTTDGNIAAFETTATMTNVPDFYKTQLVVTDGSGKRVASIRFMMKVNEAAMNENSEGIQEDASLYQQYTGTVQTLISAVRADLLAEANRAQAAEAAEASARASADASLQSAIASEASTRAAADQNLQAQVNQIIAPSGEAPSAAEVQNARIGANNVTYPTLGDAIRGQVTDLKKDFDGAITTHANFLEGASFYENYYWKRTSPLGRSSSSNHNAYYGIPVTGGTTYYYKHLFLYYTVVVYSGETAPTTLTDDTTQDMSGSFTPSSDGMIYISINKANSPLFTDDEDLYNLRSSLETYYTPNKLIINKEVEPLAYSLTNEKAINRVNGNEVSANTYWNASNFVDISAYQSIKLYTAISGQLGIAFYDSSQAFISGVSYATGYDGKAYLYELVTPPSAKYVRFTLYTYQSGVTADTAYLEGVVKSLEDVNASLKVIDNILTEPVTKLPSYFKGLLSYRQIGCLDKGYILMTCDDGSSGLATYTIPMLAQKEVPATFGLFATSDVVTNETYLQTVLDAIGDGCEAAMHGVASWSTYSEYNLNQYFKDTEEALYNKGIHNIYGAICPGVGGYDDTTELIRCVAGGRYGAVFSGGTHGEISYGAYYCAGKRTNIYAMRRISIIRLTQAQYQAAIDYAYDNHLIFCPFWHDYDIVNNTEYQAIIEGMIDYAKTKGLAFITMKDLQTIT